MKYTDESGEFLGTALTALIEWPITEIRGISMAAIVSLFDTEKANTMTAEAFNNYKNKVSTAFKIDNGLLKVDKTQSRKEQRISLISRFTWERPQTFLGNWFSHVRNILTDVNVEYYNGATLVNESDTDLLGRKKQWGMTLGSYISSLNVKADPNTDKVFAHEYGHVIQSRYLGPSYLYLAGVPSFIGGGLTYIPQSNHNHDNEWYEVWANNLAKDYYVERGMTDAAKKFGGPDGYSLSFQLDQYFITTIVFYFFLCVFAL